MFRRALIFLPLTVLLFLLVFFQGTIAQEDDGFLCIINSQWCDSDNDGVSDEEDPEKENPCVPNRSEHCVNDRDSDGVKDEEDPQGGNPCEPNPSSSTCFLLEYNRERLKKFIKDFVFDHNHFLVQIPSLTALPGSIIRRTNPNGSEYEIVCRPKQVLGEDFEPLISPVLGNLQSASYQLYLKVTAEAGFTGIGSAEGEVGWKATNGYTLSIQNPRMLTLVESDIQEVKTNSSLLTKECISAMNYVESIDKDKNTLALVQSVIIADLVSKTDLQLDQNMKVKAGLSPFISPIAKLSVGSESSTESENSLSVVGKNIFLGMKTSSSSFDPKNSRHFMIVYNAYKPGDTLSSKGRIIVGGKIIDVSLP